MNTEAGKNSLNPVYLLVALGPALLYIISAFLLDYAGRPFDVLPERLAEFDMYKAAAARTSMLGAFMLCIGAGLGALCFFVYTLRMLDWRSRLRTLGAFVVLALAALVTGQVAHGYDAQAYVGQSLACMAANYDQPQSNRAMAAEQHSRAPERTASRPVSAEQPKGYRAQHAPSPNCAAPRAVAVRNLGILQLNLVAFAFSGLMFGAACCLATPLQRDHWKKPPVPLAGADPAAASAPAANPELRHWEEQSRWLNTYLYLAALLLGTAMLFINAYLRFPAYLLLDTANYDANVAASVSYYGFVFTLMLSAFYIPVAIILSARVSALKPEAAGESRLPEAFRGPLQALKIVLGLSSTALAGILPNLLAMFG